MMRCKPLLGTYVEIAADEYGSDEANAEYAMNQAFSAIKLVQDLMGFHNPMSELSLINMKAHQQKIHVHPWTYEVLKTALEIHHSSGGIFDCGIGQHLIASGLLPNHLTRSEKKYGSMKNLILCNQDEMMADMPLQLDLGGIAKGFAVDKAVDILTQNGITSGSVNAGGDLRVFGCLSKEIQVRSPSNPSQLVYLGSLERGAIATSGWYYSNKKASPIINPINMHQVSSRDSFSVLAPQCIHADALTKVLAISGDESHSCLEQFSATAIRINA